MNSNTRVATKIGLATTLEGVGVGVKCTHPAITRKPVLVPSATGYVVSTPSSIITGYAPNPNVPNIPAATAMYGSKP